jgi:thiol-disulfide isomerase/thioredoxin
MKITTNRWKIATIVLAVVSLVLAGLFSQTMFGSAKSAADKAVSYINKNLLSNGATAKLSSIDKETIGNLRKITLEVSGSKFASYVSIDGKYLFAQEPFDLTKDPKAAAGATGTVENTGTAIEGGFNEAKDTTVCMENNKPIVYFFGSSTCPHCKWEEPVLKSVIAQFGDAIVYHENIDSDKDQDVFSKYSTGSVPTLVIGCKYYRVGSGEASGAAAEKVSLKKVICLATGNLPASVCAE